MNSVENNSNALNVPFDRNIYVGYDVSSTNQYNVDNNNQYNVDMNYTYPNTTTHSNGVNNNYHHNVNTIRNSFVQNNDKPKVFIRRIDAKRILNNKKKKLLNNETDYKDINYFVNLKGNYYSTDPCNNINNSNNTNNNNNNNNSNNNNSNTLQGVVEYKNNNLSLDGVNKYNSNFKPDQLYNSHYTYPNDISSNYGTHEIMINGFTEKTDTPLCVKEMYTNVSKCKRSFAEIPLTPVEFYKKYYSSYILETKQKLNHKNLVRCMCVFLRYIFKVCKLSLEKMKRELSTKEVTPYTGIPPLSELDANCVVCKSKYGNLIKESQQKDCLSYFEGVDENTNSYSKLWSSIDNWFVSKKNTKSGIEEEINNVRSGINNNVYSGTSNNVYSGVSNNVYSGMHSDAHSDIHNSNDDAIDYYKTDIFPKDENGKIQLPQFSFSTKHLS